MIETESHRAASKTLLAMGDLYFSGARVLPSIKLRLSPILIGPTGCGKSYLVEQAAQELDADYLKVTRGDWLVTGSRAGRSTMYQILDHVVSHDRVLVHLDELDKFNDLRSGEWAASIGTDLWNLLDGKFQVHEYLRETTFPDGKKPTTLAIALRIRSKLWIVGSGTWQEVFERSRSGNSVGFQGAQNVGTVDLGAIAKSGIISPELLHRFNGDPIFVDYPSREETAEILESSGIARLARQANTPIAPGDIDWTQGGMRVLETIATRLLLECHRRRLPHQVMIPLPNDRPGPEDRCPNKGPQSA
jgi:SpoVK/Ycf46/Vps4 family AAA+-type ATPase